MKLCKKKNLILIITLVSSINFIPQLIYGKTKVSDTSSKKKSLNLKIDRTTDEKTRYKILSPYFSPSFDTKLQLDRTTVENKEALRADDLTGYIYVNPPQGHCFRITYDTNKKDKYVCDRTSIKYRLSDLDDKGKLNWMISVDDSSSKFMYSWDSWYKFARILPSVKDKYVKEKKYPVLDCSLNIDERKITLDLFFTTWFVTLPPMDILAKDYELRYQKETQSEEETTPPPEPDKLMWMLREDKSYGLDPDSVKIDDLPPGSQATRCRYLRKTPESKFNNSLECHKIGLYEVLRVPLDCIEGLKH